MARVFNATFNYKEANYTGPGPEHLWFRIPLQLFFIGWLYFFYRRYVAQAKARNADVI